MKGLKVIGTYLNLIIQIPCYNEEAQLGRTLISLAEVHLNGVNSTIVLIDDGSADHSVRLAHEAGVDVVRMGLNAGLAEVFKKGLEYATANNIEILVNFDADNQYRAEDIPKILEPLLNDKADMVIGCRPIWKNPDFSLTKRLLQTAGSILVMIFSGECVRDAPSGFRALNRKAITSLEIKNTFTYTHESIIQARAKGLRCISVPVSTNAKTRASRLSSTIMGYCWRSGIEIIKATWYWRKKRLLALSAIILGGILLLLWGLI